VLPAVVSVALLVWLFGTVANITDTLLIFLPRRLTHQNAGAGPMYWYWSLMALVVAVMLVSVVGVLARHYLGKTIIQAVDSLLLRVPLLNKIYATTKQVNDAFSSSNKTAFRTVVLIEFPRSGVYSLGFVTNDKQGEIEAKLKGNVVSVFIPTTPNPTSGYLVLAPEDSLIKLEMSVADGIKYIISLGSILPEFNKAAGLAGAQPRGKLVERS